MRPRTSPRRRTAFARGATYVEALVVLALVITGVAAAVLVLRSGYETGAKCEASEIASLGIGSCEGAPPLSAMQAPSDVGAPDLLATGGLANASAGMTCDKYGCRGFGQCFAAGTLVAVPGGHRAIESLEPGDVVLALDPEDGHAGDVDDRAGPAPRRVVATKRTEDRPLLAVALVSAAARDVVRVTEEHPFYVEGRGWTGASSLAIGDLVVSPHGLVRVDAVTELASREPVFNLEVEGVHTYLVGLGDALVHNDCGEPRKEVDVQEPRLRKEGDGFALQRRFITGGEKIRGEPTATVGNVQDASREARAAEAMAKRPDVVEVYLGKDADTYLRKLAAERGTPFPSGEQQMPDVVGVKKDGTLLLGEGKGRNVAHAGDQFGNVGKHVGNGKIAEQWVFPPGEPRDYKLGKGGFLEETVKTIDKGEPWPKAELDKLRKSGVMVETRPRPDGGTDFVRLWKPNGVKVQVEILDPLPPKATTVAEVPAPKVTPTLVEPPAQKPAVVAEAPAGKPAAPPPESAPAAKPGAAPPGAPSLGSQLKAQGVGGGIAILGTASGKIVEHETGSKTAGVVTNVGVTTGGTIIVAKAAGHGVTKTVAGASGAALVGWGARAGTEYVTGSQTAGDLAGFGAAAGTGAAFGGPVGAVGGVVIHGASELTSNGIDYYYAKREGEALEEKRKILVIHSAFARTVSRAPTDRELAVYKRMMEKGWDANMVIRTVSGHAEVRPLVTKIWQHHFGREPTEREHAWVHGELARGAWLSTIEENILTVKASYAYILARKVDDKGLETWLDFLAKGGTVLDMRDRIASSPEAKELVVKIYRAQLGRDPTQAEADAMRERLAKGTSAYDLERELAKQAEAARSPPPKR